MLGPQRTKPKLQHTAHSLACKTSAPILPAEHIADPVGPVCISVKTNRSGRHTLVDDEKHMGAIRLIPDLLHHECAMGIGQWIGPSTCPPHHVPISHFMPKGPHAAQACWSKHQTLGSDRMRHGPFGFPPDEGPAVIRQLLPARQRPPCGRQSSCGTSHGL